MIIYFVRLLLLVACTDAFFVARSATPFGIPNKKVTKKSCGLFAPIFEPHGCNLALRADASDDEDPPEAYFDVLRLLRMAWFSSNDAEVPKTSLPRAKLIRGGGGQSSGGSFTLANPRFVRKGGNVPLANVRFPEVNSYCTR
jgi:hypothetical protein